MRLGIAIAAAMVLWAGSAPAQELRVGFMATFTGPGANLGQHLRDGFLLGLDHVGGRLGGLETKLTIVDDQLKPDVARQEVDKLLEKEKVHFVVGIVFSNVLMAIYKPTIESGAFLISANAGPSPVAGAQCSERFFSTSWQNDQTHSALGKYAQDKGYRRVFLLAPNYQAGKDGLNGFKRYYRGTIVDEVYTQLGAVDFSAEIAKIQAAKPEAVYAFMPGGPGIALLKQYAQAGLTKQIPLLSAFTIDDTSLPALGDAADGLVSASQWAADFDNPANARFVADFRKKYGYVPSYFAAQAYDAAQLIDAAVRSTGGRLDDKTALRDALRNARFASVKGKWRLNTNHIPINDFYYVSPGKLADGTPAMVKGDLVFADYGDEYAKDCPMKW
ncbi:MAG: ABC transporter substrate-binding protein [Geminicoccaceae bacterium]|nr:ABC transporter substrate-binding protein [Geminicoccaceae bacterium]